MFQLCPLRSHPQSSKNGHIRPPQLLHLNENRFAPPVANVGHNGNCCCKCVRCYVLLLAAGCCCVLLVGAA